MLFKNCLKTVKSDHNLATVPYLPWAKTYKFKAKHHLRFERTIIVHFKSYEPVPVPVPVPLPVPSGSIIMTSWRLLDGFFAGCFLKHKTRISKIILNIQYRQTGYVKRLNELKRRRSFVITWTFMKIQILIEKIWQIWQIWHFVLP